MILALLSFAALDRALNSFVNLIIPEQRKNKVDPVRRSGANDPDRQPEKPGSFPVFQISKNRADRNPKREAELTLKKVIAGDSQKGRPPDEPGPGPLKRGRSEDIKNDPFNQDN
jgi:hypothetical protein